MYMINQLKKEYQTDIAKEYLKHVEKLSIKKGYWLGDKFKLKDTYHTLYLKYGVWLGYAPDNPMYWEKGYKPTKKEKRVAFDTVYTGQNIQAMPKLSSLDSAGIYMPDINLHRGFEFVCGIARDTLKRELVKKERKPLFAAYVKACNKYQLVCLPDQTVKPLVVCGGSVWEETAGCITRFSLLVEKALGRQLTRKEGIFVKAQWPTITAVKRARIRDQSHTNAIKDNQTIYTTEGKKINQKIHSLLDAVHGYSGAVSKLRKMLAAGAIDHEFYNDRLSELRKNRDKALEILKEDGYIDTRLAYGSGRVMHNSKGVAPEKPANISKRYALDDYRIDEETGEYGKARFKPEDTRTPTIWKDGTRKN